MLTLKATCFAELVDNSTLKSLSVSPTLSNFCCFAQRKSSPELKIANVLLLF